MEPPLDNDDDGFLQGLCRPDGTPVVGPVRIQGKISKGGMGIVYRGHHLKLDIDVAVKFLFPHLAAKDPEYLVRFVREARMAAKVNNENLVRVFDVDSEKDYHYVVMELVCGETARDRVARKGPLREAEALEIIVGATRGLLAAHHQGIVHRDIKPDNIMVDATGLVKLADLGIAKAVQEGDAATTSLTQPGLVMGTPSFMPPEQMHDAASVGFPGDIYSMGATLFFLLTGKCPYEGSLYEVFQKAASSEFPDIRRLRPDVSAATRRILRKCTQRRPEDRYLDAAGLLADLERIGAGKRSLADPDTGTVTAAAKVSTPPARKVGEIRLEVTPQETPARKAAPTVPAGNGPRRSFFARRVAVPAVAGVLAAIAVTVWIVVWRDPGDAGKPAPAGTGTAVHSEATKKPPAVGDAPVAGAPAPPEAARPVPQAPKPEARPAQTIPKAKPVASKATPASPKVPPASVKVVPAVSPADTDAKAEIAKAKVRLEDGIRQARALAGEGDVPGGLRLLEELEPMARASSELEKLHAQALDELKIAALIDRTRQLIELGDTRGALNILRSRNQWGKRAPEAFKLRLRALLAGRRAREEEACEEYTKACGPEARPAPEDSACAAGYGELLAYAADVPPANASDALWEAKLAFWKKLPEPPAGAADLSARRDAARKKLFDAYLAALSGQARSALGAKNAGKARQRIEKARAFLKAENLGGELPERAGELDRLEGEVSRLGS